MRERPISVVPKFAMLLLIVGFIAQIGWYFSHPQQPPDAENLPQPPSLPMLHLASMGEPIGLSKLLLLYLQVFDNQDGVKTAVFQNLDYNRVQTWLELALQLDPRGQYPLFLAGRIYGVAKVPEKKRQMFEFIYNQFFIDPNRRWDSLAYAAIMTEHIMHDLPDAHKYANALLHHATGKDVPGWARQMDIFILENMKDYKGAIASLDELLRSGHVTDKHEVRFLQESRERIQAKADAQTSSPSAPSNPTQK